MENYFITLQAFTLEEYEIWKQLNKHCNYETNVTGYTVNQLVVNSDKRLNLTTQKVRTILKKFEKEVKKLSAPKDDKQPFYDKKMREKLITMGF